MEARSGQNYLFYIINLELFCSVTVINLLQVKLVFILFKIILFSIGINFNYSLN